MADLPVQSGISRKSTIRSFLAFSRTSTIPTSVHCVKPRNFTTWSFSTLGEVDQPRRALSVNFAQRDRSRDVSREQTLASLRQGPSDKSRQPLKSRDVIASMNEGVEASCNTDQSSGAPSLSREPSLRVDVAPFERSKQCVNVAQTSTSTHRVRSSDGFGVKDHLS